ncbi:MAG: cyclase family protein [Acidimicrobiia bacterium]|nr:cyclase family protein [Acidimicrobiia bacterium]
MPLSDELRELAAEVSNWGRWGDDDEVGTANLIDAAAVQRGLAAAGAGRHLSLAIPLDATSPQQGGAPGRIAPLRTMLSLNQTYTGDPGDACFNDDTVSMALAAGTHIDALAHVTYDGLMYNGFPATEVTADAGARRCGADKLRPILSRAVLLDVAAAVGVERLEPGRAIGADDLDAAVELARVALEPGDVALVRTGHMQLFHAGDTWGYNHDSPGLSTDTIRWIRQRDLGAVFTDTYIYEVWPPQDWAHMVPVHMIQLRDMGQVQGQNFDLEALAAACAADGVYDSCFWAAPEPFTGGCSAPVNPVVTR